MNINKCAMTRLSWLHRSDDDILYRKFSQHRQQTERDFFAFSADN